MGRVARNIVFEISGTYSITMGSFSILGGKYRDSFFLL
jgi:hypothetical protein